MLLRIFTHSLKNSISNGAVCLYGWLACHVTELRSAIHQNNENAHPARSEGGESHVRALRESGAKASSNRRTGYWYAVPLRENLRKRM